MRPAVLLLMAGAVGGALYLLFPEADFQDPRLSTQPSELHEAYLRVLLRSRPEDQGLRLLLAKGQLGLGRPEVCRETLAPLLRSPGEMGMKARLTALKALLILRHREQGAAHKHQLYDRCVTELRRLLADPLPASELAELARIGLALSQPATAAELLDRLAAAQPQKKSQHYAEAGQWYLAAGLHDLAARSHLRASLTEADPARALRQGLRAVEVLRAAGRGSQALDQLHRLLARFGETRSLVELGVALAQEQGNLALARALNSRLLSRRPGDSRLLDRAVHLAQAAGDMQTARDLNHRLLARHPRNLGWLRRQITLEQAAGDNEAAYGLARRLLTHDPRSVATHRTLARLARWTGRPDEALASLLFLASQGSSDAAAEAMTLAQALRRPEAVVELLRLRMAQGLLGSDELRQLVAGLEELGEPEEAERLLMRHLGSNPDDRLTWELLYRLRLRLGYLRGALDAARSMARLGGSRVTEGIRQARLLWRLGQPRDALSALARMESPVPFEHEAYYQLLGNLAWDLGNGPDLYKAYHALWAARGKLTAEEAERLVLAAIEQKRLDEALAASWYAALGAGTMAPLYQALSALAEAGRWEDLRQALGRLQRVAHVGPHPERWLLWAELARHDGRLPLARKALERALELRPGWRPARLAWLWVAIELGEPRPLLQALRRWEPVATLDPGYFEPFAAAYARLGLPMRALPWRRRLALRSPRDIRALMAYGETLEQAGQRLAAHRLRRHIRERLTREADAAMQRLAAPGPETEVPAETVSLRDTVLSFALLRVRLDGLEAARRWLHPVLDRWHKDPVIRRFAQAWDLAGPNPSLAGPGLSRSRSSRKKETEPPADGAGRLTLALSDGDGDRLSRLLLDPDALPLLTRLGTLLDLGHALDAGRLVHGLAGGPLSPEETGAPGLRDLLFTLEEAAGSRVFLDAGWQRLGELDLLSQRLSLRFGLSSFALDGTLVHETLLPQVASLPEAGQQERINLGLGASLGSPSFRARVAMALLLIEEDPRFVPSVEISGMPFGIHLSVAAAYAQAAEETPVLRLLGLRSRVRAEATLPIDPRLCLNLGLGWSHITDLGQDPLGHGLAGDMDMNYMVSMKNPFIRLRLTGGAGGAWLEERLPSGMQAALTPGLGPAALLPEYFVTLGLGGTIDQVLLGSAGSQGPQVRLVSDAWVGYWGPEHAAVYRVLAALRLRPVSRHTLLIQGAYGNQQGQSVGEPQAEVILSYEHPFSL